MDFSNLIRTIRQTHTALQQQAGKAINRNLTIRNWLIGFYIVEFEQKGEDRAKYGAGLIHELAKRVNVPGLALRNLQLFRSFYLAYPQISKIVCDPGFSEVPIVQTSAQLLLSIDNQNVEKVDQSFPEVQKSLQVPAAKLISKLSFSHLAELFEINNPLKRAYYEIECMKGNWSVRELRRQVNSLCFERSGLSKSPGKLLAMIADKAESMQPMDIVKSVYTFEFLGLHAKDVVEESDLETALLDNLQEFMLELGHGFCLEARQKRILIGDEYCFIDLVFFHRVLKCHVLVDLKMEAFNYDNAGQLNTYLNYYKAEIMEPGDNPPVGILLVTNKNDALVEYATAGMDRQLFVSKYLVELPAKEQLVNFIQNELRKL